MVNPITLKIRAKKLGVLIKDARLAAGKSMKDCAAATGVSIERVRAFERGEKPPSLPEVEVLAFFLNAPLEHFWSQESRSGDLEKRVESSNLHRLVPLRQRILGVLLKKARTDAGLSLKALAESVGITTRRLKSYETGEKPIPLPELEGMASPLGLPIEHFRDESGVVGEWASQQQVVSQFLNLPPELQEFVTKPVNIPYLEIAHRLSGLSVEKLRTMAEGLLDITL
jgi:transcriptional regulator with XRE-family HTH domain